MSRWANPFRIGPDCNRSQVLTRFKEWFPTCEAAAEVDLLKDKLLLCHCLEDQECHADFLLDLANGKQKLMHPTSVTNIPYTDTEDYVKGNKAEQEIPLEFIDDGLEVRTSIYEGRRQCRDPWGQR